MSGFSIVILTLNEEQNLPRCLASVAGCDDLVVLDSGSTDATVDIATRAGARVYVRPFDTFGRQRNYAQQAIAFRHPWVFHLDADELFTPELHAECRTSVHSDLDGYFVAPKMLWRGKWIPRCTDFPAWQARFVRAPQFTFIDAGHGQREAPGLRLGYLTANYLHDLSSGGETEWLDKHRRYARAEARHFIEGGTKASWGDLWHEDALRRRRALKHASYFLPFRPLARFVYQYVLKGGFRDGRAGLHYCRLLAQYESFAAAEIRRLKTQRP